ncbi:hypothetical protein [Actinomadura madurae]|uniref:hypothetical protein n=1 Tax=Actinomadura madurae TaxID=1993 RepID=UPI001C4355DC|nr:hypothetical protein [Actinomadura madurae]
MTGQDPNRLLLDKIDAREEALAREAEQTRAQIEELTARLRELDEAIDHLRITRKTLHSLADTDDAKPPTPLPTLPDHPAYQRIMATFADAGRPLRARDLCQALDLPIVSKTPRTSAPNSNAWSPAASSSRPSRDCSPSHARSSGSGP